MMERRSRWLARSFLRSTHRDGAEASASTGSSPTAHTGRSPAGGAEWSLAQSASDGWEQGFRRRALRRFTESFQLSLNVSLNVARARKREELVRDVEELLAPACP